MSRLRTISFLHHVTSLLLIDMFPSSYYHAIDHNMLKFSQCLGKKYNLANGGGLMRDLHVLVMYLPSTDINMRVWAISRTCGNIKFQHSDDPLLVHGSK